MIKINIKELKKRVPEIIFKQGLDYYKDGKVKITNWDQSSVIASVQGTHPYVVRLSSDDRFFESSCTCLYSYICKHAVAAALSVIEDYVREDEIEIGSNWREYFEKQIAIQRVDSEFSQEVRWNLVYVIHILENYWNLKPIKVYMKKDGTYGRIQEPSYNELSEQNVCNTSSDLIAISYLERLQSQQSSTYYRGRLEASYLKFGLDAGEIFSLLRNSEIHLKGDNDTVGQRIRFGRRPWRLVFRLENVNKHYTFHPYFVRDEQEIKIDEHVKILTTHPIWFYKDGELNMCSFPFSYQYLKSFIEENVQISLSKDEYNVFISDYLAKLPIFPYLEFPPGIEVQELTEITGKRLYLEEMDEQLVVSLSILYENVEVSFNQTTDQFLHFDKKNKQIIRVRRQRELEESIRDKVVASNIIEDTPGLFYANFESALDWLFDGLPKLARAKFEIMGEESLARFRVNRRKPKINMALSSEVDWFDLNLEIDFNGIGLTLEELKKALQKEKKFVRLRNGSIARLPEKLIRKLQYLIEFGQTSDGKIRFRDHHLSFVDKLLDEADKREVDEFSQQKIDRLQEFTRIKTFKIPKTVKTPKSRPSNLFGPNKKG